MADSKQRVSWVKSNIDAQRTILVAYYYRYLPREIAEMAPETVEMLVAGLGWLGLVSEA